MYDPPGRGRGLFQHQGRTPPVRSSIARHKRRSLRFPKETFGNPNAITTCVSVSRLSVLSKSNASATLPWDSSGPVASAFSGEDTRNHRGKQNNTSASPAIKPLTGKFSASPAALIASQYIKMSYVHYPIRQSPRRQVPRPSKPIFLAGRWMRPGIVGVPRAAR